MSNKQPKAMAARQKLCPCHSGREYAQCCRPYHRGEQVPQAAAQLMRARYAAYATGQVRFIMETTHPSNPQYMEDKVKWAKQLKAYCDRTTFSGLSVLEDAIDEGGARAWVRFSAQLSQRSADMSFVENSIFVKEDGARWLYLDGELRTPGELDEAAPDEA